MTTSPRILIVDDEKSMREMVSILLKRNGYRVESANSGQSVAALLREGKEYDLVITDLLMDRGGGLEVLSAVKKQSPSTEVIVITAFGTAETAVEAMKNGAFDYVVKPFNVDEFLIIVRQALERQQLIRENLDLRARVKGEYRFADIVGRSHAMKEVISLCRRVADSNATVLITGESGTGKEVVARAIHFGGARGSHPFLPVNCGALPEQLMESELFGHVKGAFTGAAEDKQGLFRAADGGTVFLDEIGELPPPLQVKMLRVLQERTVRPVGSSEETDVNIRVIAATNQDLESLVQEKQFRTDLFYRLNVINIQLPPLRERREDIPALVEHLLGRFARELGAPEKQVSQDALRALVDYDYPGNIRELSNILERAATLAPTPVVGTEDLPPGLHGKSDRDISGIIEIPREGLNLEETLERVEKGILKQALSRTGGVRTQAAKLLGISFRSLRYRLGKLGFGDEEGEE